MLQILEQTWSYNLYLAGYGWALQKYANGAEMGPEMQNELAKAVWTVFKCSVVVFLHTCRSGQWKRLWASKVDNMVHRLH